MLLQEIINAPPLPYKWISNNTGSFEFNEKLFGIVLEHIIIELPKRKISVVNISFGVVIDPTKPISASNIDRKLTGFGKPRTIMSTVADACIHNPYIKQHDIFIVAASEQVSQRIGMYTLALSELATNLPEYKFSYRAHTPNGTTLVVESKIELSQEEVEYIGQELLEK